MEHEEDELSRAFGIRAKQAKIIKNIYHEYLFYAWNIPYGIIFQVAFMYSYILSRGWSSWNDFGLMELSFVTTCAPAQLQLVYIGMASFLLFRKRM